MPFRNGTLEKIYNPNHLINPRKANYMQDATGIKTGYSGPAGFCVTASANRNNIELVAVVMGAKTSGGPNGSFANAARLMNQAFIQYRMVVPAKKGVVVGQAPVTGGRVSHGLGHAGQRCHRAREARPGERRHRRLSGNRRGRPDQEGPGLGTIVVQQNGKVAGEDPGACRRGCGQAAVVEVVLAVLI